MTSLSENDDDDGMKSENARKESRKRSGHGRKSARKKFVARRSVRAFCAAMQCVTSNICSFILDKLLFRELSCGIAEFMVIKSIRHSNIAGAR